MQLRIFLHAVFFSIILPGCNSRPELERSVTLQDYPSGSAISYLQDRIYITGDDVNYVLVTDTAFNRVDSILLFPSDVKRLSKQLKPDLEASTIISPGIHSQLLITGSGSLSPYRFGAWLIDPVTKEISQTDLTIFYERLKKAGIDALNVEGLAAIPGGMVLASRGNRSFPFNYLVFTTADYYKQPGAEFRICKVGTRSDTTSFMGVSGLEYSPATDQLLLTVSTEYTTNATDDGAIGKSYLWIIDNISSKKRMVALNPSRIVDLEQVDTAFRGHKIESVCIIYETRKVMELALVADDDNGSSTLFKIKLKR